MRVTYEGENLVWLLIYFAVATPCLFYSLSKLGKFLGTLIIHAVEGRLRKRARRGRVFPAVQFTFGPKPKVEVVSDSAGGDHAP
jgi:hypothetical protein